MGHVDRPFRRYSHGLSARLLVLTIFFVLLAEVLIFLPSMARYRVSYLEEQITSAHLVMEALRTTPQHAVTTDQEQRLLAQVDAYAVAAKQQPPAPKLMLMREAPRQVDATFDLRDSGPLTMIREAMISLVGPGDRLLRVIGNAPANATGYIEVVIAEGPLSQALRAFGQRILGLSLIISFFTAALVYMSLHLLLVRPMRRLTESMTRFRRDPEDAGNRMKPSDRLDELGVAESELAAMQSDLAAALHQKTRLAALGIAMTKISHDLKNMLSTAQLISDRLTVSDDPDVRRVAPRLEQAIDRAVNLCMQTLNFTREGPPELDVSEVSPAGVVNEVAESLPAAESGAGCIRNEVPEALRVEADRQQLYRVLANLMQNAIEAGADQVRVTGHADGWRLILDVIDNGPGLPPRARDNLFKPFAGTVKRGGTGLGLAIARDLARAHGGDVTLVSTDADGTRFQVSLPWRAGNSPAAPADPDADGEEAPASPLRAVGS